MQAFIAEHTDMNLLSESLTMMETANDIATFSTSFGGLMDGCVNMGVNDFAFISR